MTQLVNSVAVLHVLTAMTMILYLSAGVLGWLFLFMIGLGFQIIRHVFEVAVLSQSRVSDYTLYHRH